MSPLHSFHARWLRAKRADTLRASPQCRLVTGSCEGAASVSSALTGHRRLSPSRAAGARREEGGKRHRIGQGLGTGSTPPARPGIPPPSPQLLRGLGEEMSPERRTSGGTGAGREGWGAAAGWGRGGPGDGRAQGPGRLAVPVRPAPSSPAVCPRQRHWCAGSPGGAGKGGRVTLDWSRRGPARPRPATPGARRCPRSLSTRRPRRRAPLVAAWRPPPPLRGPGRGGGQGARPRLVLRPPGAGRARRHLRARRSRPPSAAGSESEPLRTLRSATPAQSRGCGCSEQVRPGTPWAAPRASSARAAFSGNPERCGPGAPGGGERRRGALRPADGVVSKIRQHSGCAARPHSAFTSAGGQRQRRPAERAEGLGWPLSALSRGRGRLRDSGRGGRRPSPRRASSGARGSWRPVSPFGTRQRCPTKLHLTALRLDF